MAPKLITVTNTTVILPSDEKPWKVEATYGIDQHDIGRPYFTVSGMAWSPEDRRKREATTGGQITDEIRVAFPWLELLLSVHLRDASTGEPMHALSNSWYWFTSHLRQLKDYETPAIYRPLTPAQRAASYLGCDPSVFKDIPADAITGQGEKRFTAAVETLRPTWAALATVVRDTYKLND